jgi:tRNA (guanine-N7-)-methyltransferase
MTTDAEDKAKKYGDWPRSYLRKQGHITRAQKRALRELWDDFGLDCPHGVVLDLDDAFGRRAEKRVLEVGFGMGENILAQAKANPQVDYVGVEVHRPGIGAVMNEVDDLGLKNVRVIRRDVLKLLRDHLPERCFDEIYLFFPEPWPRDKDADRRLIRPMLLDLLEKRLTPGSLMHIATDVRDYASHVVEVFSERERWTSLAAPGEELVERPEWRPMTKYEEKGLEEGRSIHDLCYRFEAAAQE